MLGQIALYIVDIVKKTLSTPSVNFRNLLWARLWVANKTKVKSFIIATSVWQSRDSWLLIARYGSIRRSWTCTCNTYTHAVVNTITVNVSDVCATRYAGPGAPHARGATEFLAGVLVHTIIITFATFTTEYYPEDVKIAVHDKLVCSDTCTCLSKVIYN